MTGAIPHLEHNCTSWVAVSRETGLPVFETFSASIAGKVNQSAYEVLTTLQWLQRFNRQVHP